MATPILVSLHGRKFGLGPGNEVIRDRAAFSLIMTPATDGANVTNVTASNGVKTTSGLAITSTGNVELDIASQAEAEAGSSNAKAMTPLRVAEAVAALAPVGFNPASFSPYGVPLSAAL